MFLTSFHKNTSKEKKIPQFAAGFNSQTRDCISAIYLYFLLSNKKTKQAPWPVIYHGVLIKHFSVKSCRFL